ncbi:MAG: plasmid pRiA4b ORF-3 family protein [Pirellulales bacterium]
MAQRDDSLVYVLKVALRGNKRIWRRIALRGSQTLDDLHEMIYNAFDRGDEHLYSFYFPRPGSRGRAIVADARQYAHPVVCREEGIFKNFKLQNAANARLDSLSLRVGQSFLYLFDFGDEWWHVVTVEATNAPLDGEQYPRIIERRGESPPQYPDDEEHWDGDDDE